MDNVQLIPPGIRDPRSRAVLGAFLFGKSQMDLKRLLHRVSDEMTAAELPFALHERGLSAYIGPDGLPEDIVRRMIDAAFEIKEREGTVEGVDRALQLLGISVVWEHWFAAEPEAAHDTHVATLYVSRQIYAGDNLLSAKTQRAAASIIAATQRFSQYVDFRLGVGVGCDIDVGAATTMTEFARVEGTTIMDDPEVHVSVGAAVTPTEFARIDAQTLIDEDFELAVALGLRAAPVEFIRLEGVAE